MRPWEALPGSKSRRSQHPPDEETPSCCGRSPGRRQPSARSCVLHWQPCPITLQSPLGATPTFRSKPNLLVHSPPERRGLVRFSPTSARTQKGHPAKGQPSCSFVVRGLLSRSPPQARVSRQAEQPTAQQRYRRGLRDELSLGLGTLRREDEGGVGVLSRLLCVNVR